MGIEELLLDRAKHEGKLEGKNEYALEIAREMKLKMLDIDLISELTGLSKAEINRIQLQA